jgi:hypothetical protein
MGFFDTYKEIGGNWINAEEKQEMIDKGVVFEITGIMHDDANKYGPRFVASITAPNLQTGDAEERSIGFPKGTVESRDRLILALEEYLNGDEVEPVLATLEKVGQSILIRQGA